MLRRIVVVLVVAAALGAAGFAWERYGRGPAQPVPLVLYGNVDLREVQLPFDDSARIAAILVEEGQRVSKGEVLARLDTARLRPQVAEATALLAAQRARVEKLKRGNRPDEIAEARAVLAEAKADAANAERQYQRLSRLAQASEGRVASREQVDNAQAALEMANAKALARQKALDLEMAGPRQEDIAAAVAQADADAAHLALLERQLADADLVAPVAAVVRARLMEPGEMAAPQKPVLSLAVTDPKWVRAYVSETDLGKLHPGEAASVVVDSFPGRRFAGWIGFISPVAEFTPKTVETETLRTSLVYEVRVFVKDPHDELRLGMPASVSFSAAAGAGR